jgi:hypothetical protein
MDSSDSMPESKLGSCDAVGYVVHVKNEIGLLNFKGFQYPKETFAIY